MSLMGSLSTALDLAEMASDTASGDVAQVAGVVSSALRVAKQLAALGLTRDEIVEEIESIAPSGSGDVDDVVDDILNDLSRFED